LYLNDAFGKEYAEINTTQSSVDYNNFWLGGRIVAKYDPTYGTVFLHPNSIGSTAMTTGPANSPVGAEIFYPWEQGWASGGTLEEERFAKFRQRDAGTGLDYTLNRMYPSWQGRWLTPDPGGKNAVHLDDPQTWNMYAYVRNNPTSLTDPAGLDPCCIEEVTETIEEVASHPEVVEAALNGIEAATEAAAEKGGPAALGVVALPAAIITGLIGSPTSLSSPGEIAFEAAAKQRQQQASTTQQGVSDKKDEPQSPVAEPQAGGAGARKGGLPPGAVKLKGGQGYRVGSETWKEDKLHKDHWDVVDRKGKKKREVDFNGRQIWPAGPKNRNKPDPSD